MDQSNFDATRAEAFADRMVAMINSSAAVLMTSVGHRTGLFDVMAGMTSATSEQIAATAKLNERYVREWLGAMVTAGMIDYDEHENTYRLPLEHAACLTREAAPENIAVTAQWLPVLSQVEDQVVQCFQTGGGVPYSAFNRFHEVMAEESAQTVVAGLEEHILKLDPALCGKLERGVELMDIGCGSGRALTVLASRYPNSQFYGFDLCEEAVTTGTALAQSRGLTNLCFEQCDIANANQTARFDVVTAFDVIHDQANPTLVLARVLQALKPGGLFLMQDIAGSSHLHHNRDHLLGPFMYTISTMHCMTVSLAQGGAGLGTMWGEELAEQMLNEAGFAQVCRHKLPHDMMNVYFTAAKPAVQTARQQQEVSS